MGPEVVQIYSGGGTSAVGTSPGRAAEWCSGCHWNSESITTCVLWAVTDKLSQRDLAMILAERHVDVVH